MPLGYSEQFCGRDKAERYNCLYRPGTADDIVWQLERRLLVRIIDALKLSCPSIAYLDFACGTGRVLSFVEEYVHESLGVDISPDMVRLASAKATRSAVRCEDILAEASATVPKFDLITAFRFFLNAEPALRTNVMQALSLRLRDRNSRLIFTNHGNPWSYKAVLWPLHQLRQALQGWRREGNYLTHRQVQALLRAAGLETVEQFGMGFITPKLVRFGPALARRCEQALAGQRLLSPWGVNQLYVVRRAS